MFERFGTAARRAVVSAACHAESLGHGRVGPEHVLLGVLAGADASTPGADRITARVLAGTGLTYPEAVRRVRQSRADEVRRGGLESADVAALADLGIDVDAIVARAEDSFGPGALSPNRNGRRRLHRWRRPRRPRSRRTRSRQLRSGQLRSRRQRPALPFRPDAKALLTSALVQARDLGHRVLCTEHLLLAILASGRGLAYELLREAGLDYLAARQAIMTELRRAS